MRAAVLGLTTVSRTVSYSATVTALWLWFLLGEGPGHQDMPETAGATRYALCPSLGSSPGCHLTPELSGCQRWSFGFAVIVPLFTYICVYVGMSFEDQKTACEG